MLPINKLHKLTSNFKNYKEAITHLASYTVASYLGHPVRPLGEDKPSFDISQVCCWISEQPMVHGMRLCTLNNGSELIGMISERDEDAMQTGDKDNIPPIPVKGIHANNLLLISEDTYAGLTMSLEYFAKEKKGQTLIKDPESPTQYVENPRNYKHYIWPTKAHKSDGTIYGPEVLAVNPGDYYNAQSCFVYTRKTAIVNNIAYKTDDEAEIPKPVTTKVFNAFKEFVFIEANPTLPEPLYIMAQNTIRLFRLNGRYYDHTGKDYHSLDLGRRIKAPDPKTGELYDSIETYYDDLRLAGRTETRKRARKSLDQLKNLGRLLSEKETTDILINQYKILIELSGYRSVWGTVFNDGGEPGKFNDILGVPAPTTPVPVAPVPDGSSQTTGNKRKTDMIDLKNREELSISTVKRARVINKGATVDENKVKEAQEKLLSSSSNFENLGDSGMLTPTQLSQDLLMSDLADSVEIGSAPLSQEQAQQFKSDYSKNHTLGISTEDFNALQPNQNPS